MTISNETIISLIVGGLLAIILPAAAIIIYKLRRKDTWVVSALIGAGTFLVFALVLEQLLHTVMMPVVGGNKVLYCIYGCLAAGVFEETGRFVAYKLFMKKHHTAQNAVMMGLGHGGFEAMACGCWSAFKCAGSGKCKRHRLRRVRTAEHSGQCGAHCGGRTADRSDSSDWLWKRCALTF